MSKLALSIALDPYEHALDLLTGRVVAEGVDLNWLRVLASDLGRRFVDRAEFDIADMPLAEYVTRLSQGDRSMAAIPVFTSRQFVQEAVWVGKGSAVKKIEDVIGARCATDDETASVYLRVWLQTALGRDPGTMTCPVMDTPSLHRKLAAGELDVAISFAKPPGAEPLGTDVIEAERAYYQVTKIFPIMRVVCIQSDLLDRHRWLSTSLLHAFEEAKQNSLNRLIFAGMSRYPMPWINAYVMRTRTVFGDNFWPYGIGANRTTLDAFLSVAHASEFIKEKLEMQDLFDEATWDS